MPDGPAASQIEITRDLVSSDQLREFVEASLGAGERSGSRAFEYDPTGAPACTRSQCARLEQSDRCTGCGAGEGRGETREAAADHGDVDMVGQRGARDGQVDAP
jgi:hypothetical protein